MSDDLNEVQQGTVTMMMWAVCFAAVLFVVLIGLIAFAASNAAP